MPLLEKYLATSLAPACHEGTSPPMLQSDAHPPETGVAGAKQVQASASQHVGFPAECTACVHSSTERTIAQPAQVPAMPPAKSANQDNEAISATGQQQSPAPQDAASPANADADGAPCTNADGARPTSGAVPAELPPPPLPVTGDGTLENGAASGTAPRVELTLVKLACGGIVMISLQAGHALRSPQCLPLPTRIVVDLLSDIQAGRVAPLQ